MLSILVFKEVKEEYPYLFLVIINKYKIKKNDYKFMVSIPTIP